MNFGCVAPGFTSWFCILLNMQQSFHHCHRSWPTDFHRRKSHKLPHLQVLTVSRQHFYNSGLLRNSFLGHWGIFIRSTKSGHWGESETRLSTLTAPTFQMIDSWPQLLNHIAIHYCHGDGNMVKQNFRNV